MAINVKKHGKTSFVPFEFKCRNCGAELEVTELSNLSIGDYRSFDDSGDILVDLTCPECHEDVPVPDAQQKMYYDAVKLLKGKGKGKGTKNVVSTVPEVDPWQEFMSGNSTPNQNLIRLLYEDAMMRLNKASALHDLAISQLDTLKTMCKHPKKRGYICPDCGYDNSPDGY